MRRSFLIIAALIVGLPIYFAYQYFPKQKQEKFDVNKWKHQFLAQKKAMQRTTEMPSQPQKQEGNTTKNIPNSADLPLYKSFQEAAKDERCGDYYFCRTLMSPLSEYEEIRFVENREKKFDVLVNTLLREKYFAVYKVELIKIIENQFSQGDNRYFTYMSKVIEADGDYNETHAFFRRWINYQPEEKINWYQMAKFYDRHQKYRTASKYYEKAMKFEKKMQQSQLEEVESRIVILKSKIN